MARNRPEPDSLSNLVVVSIGAIGCRVILFGETWGKGWGCGYGRGGGGGRHISRYLIWLVYANGVDWDKGSECVKLGRNCRSEERYSVFKIGKS